MKFTATKEDLLDGLQQVQNVVSTRTTLPILSNVLIETTDTGLQLTTTDLEVGIQCRVAAEIEKGGAITLPAKRLASIVREFTPGMVQFELKENNTATLRCGDSHFQVVGLPEEEYPPLPVLSEVQRLQIPQRRLWEMLKQTSYAISSDETRYVLNGVLLHLQPGKLTIVATDGRRLALAEEDLEWTAEELVEAILPAKAVHELERLLAGDGDVEVHLMENQIAFDMGHVLLISKLIEGQFPNYHQVIPSETTVRVTAEREALLAALRRVSLLLNDRSHSVSLVLSPGHMEINSKVLDVGEAHEQLKVRTDIEDLTISFNPAYLMDPLRHLDVDEVNLDLIDQTSPGVLKTDSFPFLYVLMPMRYRE